MSLANESLKEIFKHINHHAEFSKMLIESVGDLIDKKFNGNEISVSDLMNLYPSSIERNIEKYKSILE
ncbi:hypothetical protein [Fangia hongkongensis]|uniref:hypothetical protein n=1 Tax=Fangia hongkongensis TaxID=270495 RepID=UPI00036C185A|nr:hypothetical protein [Fangia hongkongensis]MBK2125895.1 hypothetical protein [Fangia hongkongensis]